MLQECFFPHSLLMCCFLLPPTGPPSFLLSSSPVGGTGCLLTWWAGAGTATPAALRPPCQRSRRCARLHKCGQEAQGKRRVLHIQHSTANGMQCRRSVMGRGTAGVIAGAAGPRAHCFIKPGHHLLDSTAIHCLHPSTPRVVGPSVQPLERYILQALSCAQAHPNPCLKQGVPSFIEACLTSSKEQEARSHAKSHVRAVANTKARDMVAA